MSDFDTIKISEFDNAIHLGEVDLKESVIPIVIRDKNYRLKLGDRFYTEKEIDNKLNELAIRIDKKLYGLDIEDSVIHTRLNELTTHISALKLGALVDPEISVSPSEDPLGYKDIYSVSNILYTPLESNRVLISNNKGKIDTININPNKLAILNSWDFKDSKNNIISLKDKILELTERIEKLEARASANLGFIDYNNLQNLTVLNSTNASPKDWKSKYNHVEYTTNNNESAWVFVQFTRGDGGDGNCGPRIWFKKKDEPKESFVEFTHIISYDYGQAAILLPVAPNTTVRVVAHGGNISRAKVWPMA